MIDPFEVEGVSVSVSPYADSTGGGGFNIWAGGVLAGTMHVQKSRFGRMFSAARPGVRGGTRIKSECPREVAEAVVSGWLAKKAKKEAVA